ncbi:hypothetical protein [Pseudomonas sp. 2(2015)]|uniref:hypothetical protein n=1 Tax=Pseudomonas sp. 2(2015) TaxID=1619950 RepID=UPI0005EAD6F2|nr:hypothetical protein [Pseudomonas sp. 2(2015)]KJK19096.1 hypothetical protein UB48_04865 [Pseudomonas sp. 2(2015)]
MLTVIREDQIADTDIRLYDDVLAVRPGERGSGVEVWHARKLPNLYHPHTPAEATIQRVLLVEVENPDDPDMQDRLRVACTDAWSRRREG